VAVILCFAPILLLSKFHSDKLFKLDFGDTGEINEDEAKYAELINIQEVPSDSSDSQADESSGPFPATNLVLRLNPRIRREAITYLIEKITAKKHNGGAELLVRCEPFSGRSGEVRYFIIYCNFLCKMQN